ncbi:hypothetical protein BAU01nite_23760 [Brevibacterium aurantiacum]|uniref:Uncharacterized protein n=1 Tax=Brevibacterium aurantiacum TaxID=273384 RepID=A0A2H1KFA2_BREAU|nr:hypothetical protein BAU01nite_23760 [Brevibacterium aurantiacum]SMX98410.1 hypothetical protein BAUR9175_03433 [Brevibacterium aurantiacum]
MLDEVFPGARLGRHQGVIEQIVDDLVNDSSDQFVTAVDMSVQCHRLETEGCAQPTHRECLNSVFVDIGDGTTNYVIAAEPLTSHRLHLPSVAWFSHFTFQ